MSEAKPLAPLECLFSSFKDYPIRSIVDGPLSVIGSFSLEVPLIGLAIGLTGRPLLATPLRLVRPLLVQRNVRVPFLEAFHFLIGREDRRPVDDVGIAVQPRSITWMRCRCFKWQRPLDCPFGPERPAGNEVLARIAGTLRQACPINQAGKNRVFGSVEVRSAQPLLGLPLRTGRRVFGERSELCTPLHVLYINGFAVALTINILFVP